jgi:hypothetical protein
LTENASATLKGNPMMSILLVGALTLGSGTIVLFGLWSIGRGLICESSIDAPSMPEFDERAFPETRPDKVGSSSNGRRLNNQASSTPTLE